MWTLGKENNFYKSKQWKDLIEYLKNSRVNPEDGLLYCAHCGKPIVKKYDCIGHHNVHLTEENVNDATISLNPDNIKFVHMRCHNKIHKKNPFYNYYKRPEVYIVFGPPCSGKTSFVKESALDTDLIVDMDNIWQMISINERYVKPNNLKSNVFQIRDFLIDMIKRRSGKWTNAWIIAGLPLKMERERLKELVNANKIIYIDTPKEECIKRCLASRPKETVEDWLEYIENWFDDYVE